LSLATPEKNLQQGTLIGVGVGPGDPELLTLKALRLIKAASCISYLANDKGQSQAKNIAIEALQQVTIEQQHIVIKMPMSTDRRLANQTYDFGAKEIQKVLATGKDVVFLCEGDPLFFGSFAYILERLQNTVDCLVIPGISSVHAAAATLVQPLTIQKESFAVVSGRHTDDQLVHALRHHDTVVVMKAGRERERIVKLLHETERFQEGRYLEYIGRSNQKVVNDLNELETGAGSYFSLFVICRDDRNFTE